MGDLQSAEQARNIKPPSEAFVIERETSITMEIVPYVRTILLYILAGLAVAAKWERSMVGDSGRHGLRWLASTP
jgi:hypothetical protein